MSNAITEKQLQILVTRLNAVTGNDQTAWRKEGNRNVSSVGNYHLGFQYGGVSLEQMVNEGGGIRSIFGTTTKRELFNQIHAYLRGMEDKGIARNPRRVSSILADHARAIGKRAAKAVGRRVHAAAARGLSDLHARYLENPAGIRIVHNKLLGGWYVVRGPHQTPLNGRFDSKAEAQAWLLRKNPRASSTSTRTEVRSPTSTETRAYTRGNVTVTGGAGAGNTSVTLRRNPHRAPKARRVMRPSAAGASGARRSNAMRTVLNYIELRGVITDKVYARLAVRYTTTADLKAMAKAIVLRHKEAVSAHRVTR